MIKKVIVTIAAFIIKKLFKLVLELGSEFNLLGSI